MSKIHRPGHHISWAVKRRRNDWLAVVYLGEAPVTTGAFPTKPQARAYARERAANFRVSN